MNLYTPAKDIVTLFKNKYEEKKAKEKLIKVFKQYKKETGKHWRSLDALVKESGLSTKQTEHVLNELDIFRRDVKKESKKELWTFREFDDK